jgi:hypothetical protein
MPKAMSSVSAFPTPLRALSFSPSPSFRLMVGRAPSPINRQTQDDHRYGKYYVCCGICRDIHTLAYEYLVYDIGRASFTSSEITLAPAYFIISLGTGALPSISVSVSVSIHTPPKSCHVNFISTNNRADPLVALSTIVIVKKKYVNKFSSFDTAVKNVKLKQ